MSRATGPGRVEVETEYSSSKSINAALYNFDIDGAALKAEHVGFLNSKVVPLLRDPYTHVFLLGSASRVGASDHNLRLSEKRVSNVADFLKAHGAAEYQLQRTAVGEARSFGLDADNERHRAVVILVAVKKRKATIIKVPQPPRTPFDPHQHLAPGSHQFQLVVRTFIPQARFFVFAGDNRTFSMSPHATYRTGMFVAFDLSTGKITESLVGNSTGTTWRLSDRKAYADIRTKLVKWEGDRGRILIHAHMEGSDPLVPSPDVDTDIILTAFLRDGNLFVTGKIIGDAFPSTEAFIRDNQRNGHRLLYYATPYGGQGAIRLLGAGTRDLGDFKEGIQLDENARFVGDVPW